ncbi:MAG: cell division protein FtsA [Armatimonadetes bacterium]|nr:cell division protein FtsA [Armatimonadota bacterium]
MPRKRVLVGLDIGTTKVCAIVAERDEDGEVHIAGMGRAPSVGLKRGVVTDLDATTRAIQEAIEKAERMCGHEVSSTFVAVSGQHIASQNSRGVVAVARSDRQIGESDVARVKEAARIAAIPAADREVIHLLSRHFVVDGQEGVRNPVGMFGTRLEMEAQIVTGATTLLANVVKCVREAGLEVDEMVLEPLASAEAVLSAAERDLGVAVCDIGGGTSSLGIFIDGGLVHTVVLPVGGHHITNDIAVGLRTAAAEAEKLKARYGAAASYMASEGELVEVLGVGDRDPKVLPRRFLVEIIEPRVDEILGMIRAQVRGSGYQQRIPAGMVLTGGTAQLRGLAEMATDRLGIPTRIGSPENISGLADTVNSPAYATAVGLVLYEARGRGEAFAARDRDGAGGGWWQRATAWLRGALQGE